MESPRRNHGGSEEEEEEYSSCESGWTMYIEDAFHGNDHSSIVVDDDDEDDNDGCDIDDDDVEVKEADYGDRGDEESDDSMTSDASSGPSNQFSKSINKHAGKKNGSKQVYLQKRQEKTISSEGEKSELKAKSRASAASRVQSRDKLNKTK